MGFRYQLCTPDGEVFGEAEYAYQPAAGDEVYVNGNECVRVRSVIPIGLASEFVDRRCTVCSKSSHAIDPEFAVRRCLRVGGRSW